MNAQKLTQKSIEAVQAAHSLAVEHNNPEVRQEHLLAALLGQQDGLIGSLLAVLLPAPKSRVRVVCGCLLVSMGTENFLLAFGRNLPTWCVGAALGWLLIPVMSANLDALMRLNIPEAMQGRVYAVRNALQFFTIPVGYTLGGALVDAVFRPMMRNPLPWLEMLFGRDEGSGAACFYAALALMGALTCLFFQSRKSLKTLEGDKAA